MNGKAAKMLRRMKANDTQSKRLWKSLNHIQRTKVRSTYRSDGPAQALVTFAEQLRRA